MTIEMTHSTVRPHEEVVAEEMEPDDLAVVVPSMPISPGLDEAHRAAAERNQLDFMSRMKQRIAETAACRCIERPAGSR